jgi:hypothetical protein
MTQAYTHRFTEVHEIQDYLVPAVKTPAAYTTAYVELANHQRVFYILITGTMVATSTVNLQIWQATDTGGTAAKVIVGKAITALTQAGGDGDDIVGIEVRTEELDVDGGFAYVAAILTIGVANCAATLLPLFGCSNYPPVPVANWTEIID